MGLGYRIDINRFNLNLEYAETGRDYRRIDNYKSKSSHKEKIYRSNINLPTWNKINFIIGASKYVRDCEETKNFNIGLSRYLFNSLNITFNFEKNYQDNGKKENRLYFTLNYNLGRNSLLIQTIIRKIVTIYPTIIFLQKDMDYPISI